MPSKFIEKHSNFWQTPDIVDSIHEKFLHQNSSGQWWIKNFRKNKIKWISSTIYTKNVLFRFSSRWFSNIFLNVVQKASLQTLKSRDQWIFTKRSNCIKATTTEPKTHQKSALNENLSQAKADYSVWILIAINIKTKSVIKETAV